MAVSQNLILFRENGKVGYKDKATKKVLIQPTFTYGEEFKDGLAIVSTDELAVPNSNKQFRVINPKGVFISDISCVQAKNLGKGLIKIAGINGGNVEISGGVIYLGSTSFPSGLMDKTGKLILKPEFNAISDVASNLLIITKSDSVGVMDITGKYVLPLQTKLILDYKINNGFIIFNDRNVKGDVKGIMDKNCKIILDPSKSDYKEIEFNACGMAKVLSNSTGLYGLIDSQAKVKLEPKYKICSVFSDKDIVFKNQYSEKQGISFDCKGNKK